MWLFALAVALAAAPDAPALVSPADGASDALPTPTLAVTVSDPDGDALEVRFLLRERVAPGEDFTIIALPDTQFYACGCSGGETATFGAQTAWIAEQQPLLNIAYVAQLGDCVQNGDDAESEWVVADEAFAAFDEGRSDWPLPTGGLPYGIAVGNHDQSPMGDAAGTTTYYNQYFGIDRFATKFWYGGYAGVDYDNHYDLFEAGGTKFIALYFEYDTSPDADVLAWADAVLSTHADRHAIIVSHYLLNSSGTFSSQGQDVYDALSHHEALFLMLAGHVSDEASREDSDGPRTVTTLLSDYQSRDNGGDGWLRVLSFSPTAGAVDVSTYSPTLGEYETDEDSTLSLAWDPNPAPWVEQDLVAATDGAASTTTADLGAGTSWEWKVEVSDGTDTVTGPTWTFAVAAAQPVDTGDDTADSAPPDEATDTQDSGPTPADSDGADSPGPDSDVVADDEPNADKSSGCGRSGGAAALLVLLALPTRRRTRAVQ